MTWPPRSPDITPLDFYLWGYVKQHVFSERINDINHLKQRITDVIHSVTPDVLTRVWEELDYRLDVCRATYGTHIELRRTGTRKWAVVDKDNWTHPSVLISEAISEPHIPSKEGNRLRPAFFVAKETFLDRLSRCERVKGLSNVAIRFEENIVYRGYRHYTLSLEEISSL
ncbi:hypothetical protein AVEN_22461-1 [Araneus ventricosus]|uniref:Uncharacterized protein n=1 Tax=Araneus ventricosus TaxID=182803 RepID=A0A4Y2GEQ2_ARAVE|nr:hypothetical protein AVEN_220348-1 [Araneus ventricosus]GBM50484.1 hypothetical protein AVEN_22461-1 [Araneus ventricosus]